MENVNEHGSPRLYKRRQCVLVHPSNEETPMLHYAIVFLVIALIAAVLGFGGLAGSAIGIAKILFFVFLVLFVISLIMGRRGPRI